MPQLANERPYLNGIVGIRPAADEATIEAFYRDLLNVSDFQAMPVSDGTIIMRYRVPANWLVNNYNNNNDP